MPNNAGPYHVPTRRRPHLPKRQNPYHRSSALISSLRHEEALRLIRSSRAVLAQRIPAPRAGMLIRVAYAPSLAPEAPVHYFTGICIAAARRGLGSCVVLRNVVDGVAVERAFACYSPLVRDATVLAQRNVRKSKLYYLRRKPLRQSNVGKATQRPQ
ncbi:50S ribosomal protein L19 [Gracilariopsis chorda]|uniref:50S ribosomal protein L19 n=1 Tax=Gracilariopsis chorda TaxID=448386 RepID=A0A2V3IVS3_9FLOR|nr:50S ribosomal protein L19 [Gracilariopsis chorda]|eukprot:PXF46183.1 50S ribosomal protein L19 [Gracilariopsis chorda]